MYAADQLFATLDPTLRQINVPVVGRAIISDTVGFIRDLPHALIEAFKATLEEVAEADLILHVVDAAAPERQARIQEVNEVLHEIGAAEVPQLLVFNKVDCLDEPLVRCIRMLRVSRIGCNVLYNGVWNGNAGGGDGGFAG